MTLNGSVSIRVLMLYCFTFSNRVTDFVSYTSYFPPIIKVDLVLLVFIPGTRGVVGDGQRVSVLLLWFIRRCLFCLYILLFLFFLFYGRK